MARSGRCWNAQGGSSCRAQDVEGFAGLGDVVGAGVASRRGRRVRTLDDCRHDSLDELGAPAPVGETVGSPKLLKQPGVIVGQ